MMTWKRSTCNGCFEPIVWSETENGRRMPLDFEPTEDGTFVLVPGHVYHEGADSDTPVAVFHKKADHYIELGASPELRMSHHATCPNADRFRR